MAAPMKSKRSMGQPKKKKMKDMTVDEFFSAPMDSDSESSSKSSELPYLQTNGKVDNQLTRDESRSKSSLKKVKTKSGINSKLSKDTETDRSRSNIKKRNEMVDRSAKGMVKKHDKIKKIKSSKNSKPSLATTLQENDPEFYEYLKGEDQSLLDNLKDLSDEDDDSEQDITDSAKNFSQGMPHQKDLKMFEKGLLNSSSESEDDDSEQDTGGGYHVHKLPDKLEVASDDSGTESENEQSEHFRSDDKGILVTNKLLGQWAEQLQAFPSPKVFKEIVSAFHGAVYEAGGKMDDSLSKKYKIKGSSAFNGIVRLCLLHVAPALQSILKISSLSSQEPVTEKNKKWKKVKTDVKSYISALLQLLSQLSEAVMINAILKHVHKLVTFYASFPKSSRTLLKQMIKMWTTGEETSHVLAFLCINKLIHLKRDPFLEISVKKLYMAYVSNCRFVSPTTLPLINFMQHSFVEVLSNDFVMAYQYAFVYIRQLAIHLRNAIAVKKKNMFQIVYNWQYIHCLGLWVQLLSSYPNDTLKPLIYPLTQTIIGTIKLVPTARYYPLRFHCIKLLNVLSSKTNTYIPTLPFLLDVFEQTDFNKKHKSVSLKPFNFAVMLKFSKSQLHEKAFKDGLIDQLYELLLESYNIHAHSVGFPELIIPSLYQLKDFTKKCKIANYCKQIKQIIDKIEEQSKFLCERRKQSTLRLDDFEGVRQWEQSILTSPLRKFYISWRKLRDRELQHEIAHKEVISGAAIDIPSIAYKKVNKKATQEERESLSKLFEDDSDSDNETRFLLKEERSDSSEQSSRKRKKVDADETDSEDYSDFDDEELEQLARSASENESESDMELDQDDFDVTDSDGVSEEGEGEPLTASKVDSGKKVQSAKKGRIQPDSGFKNSEADDVVQDFVLSDSDDE